MTDICLRPERMEALLTEINRHRALTDDEADILEAIINRGHQSRNVRRRWTASMDRKLKQASHSKGGIRRFADRQGISDRAAYSRLHKIKAREAQLQKRKGKG